MTPMATCTSKLSESRLIPRDRLNRTPACTPQRQTSADWLKSIGGIVIYPTVTVTPAETAKRLGTGWHWRFSETIRVPIGTKVEFRFQGPTHLLALYDAGVGEGGETSIDDVPSSSLEALGVN
jgi:AraC family transcriptional regulator